LPHLIEFERLDDGHHQFHLLSPSEMEPQTAWHPTLLPWSRRIRHASPKAQESKAVPSCRRHCDTLMALMFLLFAGGIAVTHRPEATAL
jgi:hypothetical protein